MKQHIAKLLVFLMLMTTMIVPADLSFAESGNENTTQTEESNDPQEKPDSTQETPVKSTDDEKIVENESSPNSSAAKESIIAAENDRLEETVTERMEFLYIESKELVAPGTQNIVVSWKEAIDDIQNMVLVYENEQGKTFTLKESKRNDESIVFKKDFAASEAGTYKIKGVQYFIGNEEKYFAFDDVEIAASFKVVKGQTIEDDAIAKVEVDSNGTVDKKEVNAEIKDAVTSTDAAPKAQTKARRAKSSNIVVVLDPGHGGSDSGARRGSVYEKNINFKVAQYCKAELEQYCGVTVYMTRTGDTNPSLQERAQIAANYGANILVSIHQNSGSSSAYGAEVYYPNRNYKPAIGDSGKAVADSIQKELVSLGLSNRGTKIRNTANGSTYADGSYSDYYGIIRNSKNLGIPAIIVEHAFLSNASDYNNFLSSDSKLQKLGIADATGIAKAFGLSKGRWETIGGEKFYIYASGEKAYGAKKIGSTWYYFDEKTGAMHTGWRNAGEKKCYYNDKGELQFGAQKIDGKWYYFNDSGYMHTGWRNAGGKKCYYNDKGELQFGAVEIDGQWYYFNNSGYLDAGWFEQNGSRYYINSSGGKVYGAKKIGNTWYYFDEKTGAMHTGWRDAGEKKCYYNDKGELQFGAQKIDGKWYYFNDSGYMHTGWRNAGGKKCYYNDKGELQFGAVEIEGQWYYFNDSGYLDAGWFEQNGKRYYIDSTGEKAYGAKKIGNTWYYFDEKTGAMHTGWRNAGEKKCYYNDKGELQFGAVEINGQWYHFDDSGYLKAGWIEKGGKRYYMDASGENVYGAKKIGNTWYYFDEKTGAMHTGWRDAGEKKCYYNDKGELQFGAQKIDGKWYYFNDSGYMHTGWRNAGGKKCYYNDKGELQFGAVEIDGQWYYFNDSGYLDSGWFEQNGKRYYIDSTGEKAYGAKKIGNTWYYFDEKTGAMHTGWRNAGGKKCYYNDKGELQFGAVEIDGKWYYFNDSGYMHTGWRNAGGKKCYYNDKGELQFGAVEIEGQWYYFNDSGYLVDKHVISGKVATNASQLATFYRSCGGKAFPKYYSNNDKEATNLLSLCQIYVEEAEAENINVDVAFCQAMLETGWLQYRGAVKIESFNFAGIGAVDSNPTGAAKFKSAREGIRAQIQHLKAYANKLPLNNEQVDPRFLLVKRGSAPNVEDLGGKWASDVQYGNKIVKLMEFLWSCQS